LTTWPSTTTLPTVATGLPPPLRRVVAALRSKVPLTLTESDELLLIVAPA
jgi:hypothetical protein